jgi:hypothetical protein
VICIIDVGKYLVHLSKLTTFYPVLDVGKGANVILNVAEQLNDRLAKAGFTDIKLKKQDMKLNHTDKGGELVW